MVDPPCSEVNPSSLFPLPVLPDPARLQVPVADVRVEQVHREHRRVLKHLDRVGIRSGVSNCGGKCSAAEGHDHVFFSFTPGILQV